MSASVFFSSPNLPSHVDINELSPYLLVLPGKFADSPSDYQQKLMEHFNEAVSILTKQLEESYEYVAKTRKRCEDILRKEPPILSFQTSYKYQIRKYIVLNTKMNKVRVLVASNNLHVAESQFHIIKSLLAFAQWLVLNPHTVFINLNRALPGLDARAFSSNQKLFREHRAFKMALSEQIKLINQLPPFFRTNSENRNFLRCAVDSAMASRKAGTTYFEPLAIEESLFAFLDSTVSPLAKTSLLPIQIESDFNSVSNWIQSAVSVITKFDSIDNIERKEVINVFAMRFLFERTYPLLRPENQYSVSFSRAMQTATQKSPLEMGIPEKYIPAQCMNVPVAEMFSVSSISSAPIEWLRYAQFKVSPLDVAFCIFKVHESLSIMATLQATNMNESQDSEEFFAKMPGFDDIFDLWLSSVCVSGVTDPKGICEFISKWSRLQGFPSRFLACCAYLEASISQIEEKFHPKPNTSFFE